MTVADPIVSPVMMPVVLPIVAVAGLLMLHVPPEVSMVSVLLMPIQTLGPPEIVMACKADVHEKTSMTASSVIFFIRCSLVGLRNRVPNKGNIIIGRKENGAMILCHCAISCKSKYELF